MSDLIRGARGAIRAAVVILRVRVEGLMVLVIDLVKEKDMIRVRNVGNAIYREMRGQ